MKIAEDIIGYVINIFSPVFTQIASLSHGSEMNVEKALPLSSVKVSQWPQLTLVVSKIM